MDKLLTNRQILYILLLSISNYNVMTLPRLLAKTSSTTGWFAILLTVPIPIIMTYILIYLGITHKNQTLYEYTRKLLGKYTAYCFGVLYFIIFFVNLVFFSLMTTGLVNQYLLQKTPVWSITLPLVLTIFYIVSKKLPTIGRLSEFYGSIILYASIAFLFLLLFNGNTLNIKPLITDKMLSDALKTIPKLMVPFLGMEVLTVIPLCVNKNKGIVLYSMLANIIISFIYIFTYEACLSMLGIKELVTYKTPLIAAFRELDLPFLQMLRRLDNFVILIVVSKMVCYLGILAYASTYYAKVLLPKIKVPFIVATLMIIVGLCIIYIKNVDEIVKLFNKYIMFSGLISGIIIPITLLIATEVRKSGKKNPM